MTKKMNNKPSAKRKLLPAIGMLTVSAMMLSSSTYAWFTMSKEVEVKNIRMTATAPDSIQISLGALATGYSGEAADLSKGTGIIKGGTAENPVNSDTSLDWSNSADFSRYYALGKLTPASSTTGANLFKTNDATGNGRTVADSANFTAVSNSEMATLYAFKNTENHSAGNEATIKDGYYVDIPVWFRNSGSSAKSLIIRAVATAGNQIANSNAANELYKAVRVAVLSSEDSTAVSNIVDVRDGSKTGNSIVDYYEARTKTDNTTSYGVAKGAVNAAGTLSGDTYKAITEYNNQAVVTVAAKSTDSESNRTLYGPASKIIVRVWLEGEDPECWDANASQNFGLTLYFADSFDNGTGTGTDTGTGTGTGG